MNLTSSDTLDRRWDEKERCGREMRKTFSYIFLCLPFSFLRPKWTIISGLCEPLGRVFVPSTCMLSCIMTRRGARDLHRTSSSVIMRLRLLFFFRGSRGFIFQFAEWKRERETKRWERLVLGTRTADDSISNWIMPKKNIVWKFFCVSCDDRRMARKKASVRWKQTNHSFKWL